jgi:isoquinoline 1-oxidoreductase beta subunit
VGRAARIAVAACNHRGWATGDGCTLQRNFGDYPVIGISEAPVVEVHVVESSLRPFGIGEQPVPPVAPAVLNVIFAVTGRRIWRVPLCQEDLG